jgi:ankyrin repeat protein
MKALLRKIEDGQTDLVFEYLAHAAETSDYAALVRACEHYGDVSALKYLLANGATLSMLGQYALNNAAFHGHGRLVSFLIASGMSVDDPVRETGETSLHSTFGHQYGPGHDDVVRILLDSHASVNVKTIPGVRTEAFTHSKTRGETALHRAAAFGTVAAIEMLTKHGADIGATDAAGETPLAWASRYRRPGAILERLRHPIR